MENGYHLMDKAVETLGEKLPTAFFTAADPIAVGCLQALNEKGIAIPGRVSIISINNISVAKYVSPPLTTFHIDIKELCKNAIELLLEQILQKRNKSIILNKIRTSEPISRAEIAKEPRFVSSTASLARGMC